MSTISNSTNFTHVFYPKGYPKEGAKDAEYVPHSETREWLTWADHLRSDKNKCWELALESISGIPSSTIEQVSATRGLAVSKFCDLMVEKVNACAFEYLNKSELIELLSERFRDIRGNDHYLRYNDLNAIFKKISNFIQDIQSKIRTDRLRSHSTFKLSREEFALIQPKGYEAYERDVKHDCEDFAVYHMHESPIFKSNLLEENASVQFFPWEPSNGYTKVAVPQLGDVVVYSSKNGTQFEHFGVSLGNKRLCSKWCRGGKVYNHEVQQIPLGFVGSVYGESVRYFRKTTRFEVTAAFISELEKLHQHFSGNQAEEPFLLRRATYSILSQIGMVECCQTAFNQMVEEYAKRMIPRSLFGRTCMLPLKAIVSNHVEALIKEIETSKAPLTAVEIVEKLKKLIFQSSYEVPLNPDLLLQTNEDHLVAAINALAPAKWTYSVKDLVTLSMKGNDGETASVRDTLKALGVPMKRFKVGQKTDISYLLQVIDPRLNHLHLINAVGLAAIFADQCYAITALINSYCH